MKLYVSGPITGHPNKNQEAFEEAAVVLKQLGHKPVTPFDLDVVYPRDSDDWVANMKRDVEFLPKADGVVVIDGWQGSKGAKIEIMIASALNIPVFYLTEDATLETYTVGVETTIELTGE